MNSFQCPFKWHVWFIKLQFETINTMNGYKQ
jgi:hypothetical protein